MQEVVRIPRISSMSKPGAQHPQPPVLAPSLWAGGKLPLPFVFFPVQKHGVQPFSLT